MKKYSFLSFALISCLFMGMMLIACGDDDEPDASSDFSKTEFTKPMFIYSLPTAGIETLANEFSFYTFTDNKAAFATFYGGIRPYVICHFLNSEWGIEGNVLSIGRYSFALFRFKYESVLVYKIGGTISLPSNLTVLNVKAEDIFTTLGYDKARLWRAIEKSNTEHSMVYLDEEN